MTVLNTGSNKKFAAGWEGIFAKGTKSNAGKKAVQTSASAKKKRTQKPATKKVASRAKKAKV